MFTCLNSSHLERTRHLMQYTYQDVFLLLKTVFELVDFDACSTAVFCFTSSTSAKCFPLRTLFIRGHTQKVTQGEIGWIGRVGHRGHAVFLIKNCWTVSVVWADALVNHPSWNGQTPWKSLQKDSLKPNAASHHNASWCTGTDGFLEHSPS